MSDSISRRSLIQAGAALLGGAALSSLSLSGAQAGENAPADRPSGDPGSQPHDPSRRGGRSKRSKVYFTKDISAAGIINIYKFINKNITGKVALKVHTGEPNGPNIIPPAWVMEFQKTIPNSTIVECNVLYDSPRHTTEGHRRTLRLNGWNADAIDIMDADGEVALHIPDGRQLKEIRVGKNMINYDSMVVLTHFKGHEVGGFGGSLKNIAIGCSSGSANGGKQQIHHHEGDKWPMGAEMLQRMAEGGKGIVNYFAPHITYINVLRRMSVDCDCAGTRAEEPKIPDFGILASDDILAIDQASVDLIFKLGWEENKEFIERICSRDGLCQLQYMRLLNMGNSDYDFIEV